MKEDGVVVRRIRNTALALASVLLAGAPLAACGLIPHPATTPSATTASGSGPSSLAGAAAPALPVPHGSGSGVPEDFNGDGHRDLVLNNLVKAPGSGHDDDAGLGIVYGTAKGAPDPAVRRLLTPRANGAKVKGVLPSAFDAVAACDLDKDGFSDLIVATDPPYNGVGRPPVPLQLLFGSPSGLGSAGGKAVVLRIPEQARYGNEWPDHPVCGDFDGDGYDDLAVTASGGRVSFLHGPFTRTGAPRAAAKPIPGAGPVLAAPSPKADANGDGYDDLVHSTRSLALAGNAAEGKLLLGGEDGPRTPGGSYTFKAVRVPAAPALPAGESSPTTDLLRYADFDGDTRPDVVTRTHRGESADVIAFYPASGDGSRPTATFSTAVFLQEPFRDTP
ncbi:FG-GAP repeat domain-containing protein [Streptomyces sp. NPDC127084]|uniref:FG-GAP repeat domain-containing protein n=1 Tax=Streptomyces sp. NPDC127084 TaxID=3347133 RepID=UPI00364C7E95